MPDSSSMPTSARTGDGEAASAVDRELRRRAAHEALAHRTRRESQFEVAVLEAHHTPSPDTDDAAAGGASSGRMSGAGPTRTTAEPALTDRPWHPAPRSLVLALVGGYAVWSPMVQLTWVQAQILYGLALGLGVLAILGGTWRRVALVPLALFLSNWAVLWATHAHWAAWDTTYSRAVQEAYALRACGLNSTAVVLLCGAGRFGARSVRRLWGVLGVSLLVMALLEVSTGRHFSPAGPYAPPTFSPSGPFGNPNNLACVLVVVFGLVLGRMSERLTGVQRTVLGVVAVLTVVLVVLTLSRAAVAGCAVMAVAGGVLALGRSRRTLRLPSRAWARGVVAVLVIPAALAAAALWHLVAPGDAERRRADGLRLTLGRIALDHWRAEPWFGIGGGRFEMILRDQYPEVGYVLPVHNTFVEFLCEYGIVGSGSLFLLLLLAVVVVVLPVTSQRRLVRAARAGGADVADQRVSGAAAARSDRLAPTDLRTAPDAGAGALPHRADVSGRPRSLDAAGARHLAFVFLVGIVLAGTVPSSALNWQVWWLMIAPLTVLTGHLLTRRFRS